MTSKKTRQRVRAARLQFETLEARKVFAGDVVAVVRGGDLFLFGDSADNQVEVRVDDSGNLVVAGLNGTKVNGSTDDFIAFADSKTVPSDVRAYLGRGNDQLRIDGVEISDDLLVFASSGDDAIGIDNSEVGGDVLINSSSGADGVSLEGTLINGNLSVDTGIGDDRIGIDQSQVLGRTHLTTGTGSDALAIRDSTHVGNVSIDLGNGDDFAGIQNADIQGRVSLRAGGGDDNVLIRDSSFSDQVFASGDWGIDNLVTEGTVEFAVAPRTRAFEGQAIDDAATAIADVFSDLTLGGAKRRTTDGTSTTETVS